MHLFLEMRSNDDTPVEKVSKTSPPVNLSVAVPETLRKAGRTFYLLTVHDGKTALIAKGTRNTLVGNCDRFSTFLIAYQDTVVTSPNEATESTADSSSKSLWPKTGDISDASALFVLAAAMAFASAGLLRWRERS